MKITIVFIGSLIEKMGFSEKNYIFPDGTVLRDIIEKFGLEDYKENRKLILRNGKPINENDLLKEGDRIIISHIYSGG
jgi:sulfur carrier protein ThiS